MDDMSQLFGRNYDYADLDLEDDSASDDAESSEDEIEILLHGTPEQKRKLTSKQPGSGQERREKNRSSSEDDFEKEMNEELDETVAAIEARNITPKFGSGQVTGNSGNNQTQSNGSQEQQGPEENCYDEVYFDSDEEEMVEGTKRSRKHPVLSNDDLLYDPNMDDEDQHWVDTRRRRYQPSSSQSTGKPGQSKRKGLPNSDAVLDCPACMTTLCLDCQRHDIYKNQYRAMFVSHCKVDFGEVLKYPKGKPNKKLKKKTKFNIDNEKHERHTDDANLGEESSGVGQSGETDCVPGGPGDNEDYHPVRCTECNTVVAVYDRDEIYHFFNVLSSYS